MQMRVLAAFLGVAVLTAFGAASAAEPAYDVPLGVDCTSQKYQAVAIERRLPPALSFLYRSTPEGSAPGFVTAEVGDELQAGVSGTMTLRRPSFGLLLKKPITDDYNGVTFSGTLEVFKAKEFCELLARGLSVDLASSEQQVATFRLVPRIDAQPSTEQSVGAAVENGDFVPKDGADIQTLDRIGDRYFDDLRYYLSDTLRWSDKALVALKTPPWPAYEDPMEWLPQLFADDFYCRDNIKAMCDYFRLSASVQLFIDFLEASEVHLTKHFDDQTTFRFSQVPGLRAEVGEHCINLVASTDLSYSLCRNPQNHLVAGGF